MHCKLQERLDDENKHEILYIVYAVYTVFTVFIQLCKQLNKQYSSVPFVYEKLAKPMGNRTQAVFRFVKFTIQSTIEIDTCGIYDMV